MQIFNFKKVENTKLDPQRVKYLTFLFLLGSIFIPFYLFKDTFWYTDKNLQFINWPLYFCFILTPLLSRFVGNFEVIGYITGIISSIILSLVIFQGGGVNATGAFWLCIQPINFGILIGRRGVWVGGFLLIAGIAGIWILEKMGIHGGNLVDDQTKALDSVIDLAGFAIYIIFTMYYFISKEENARSILEENKKSSETLLRTVVHDIASPIQVAIAGLKQIETNPKEHPNYDKGWSRVQKSIHSILEIITQVRQMQSIKDGKSKVTLEKVNLQKIILDVVELISVKAEMKNIQIQTYLGDEPLFALGDEVALKNMVLLNFLSNSIKFSEENAIIEIKLSSDEEHANIEVRDFGMGIPDELMKKIWSLSESTSRIGTAGEKGTGYGMPLAREFVEKMSGKVIIKSKVKTVISKDHGTHILIQLIRKLHY